VLTFGVFDLSKGRTRGSGKTKYVAAYSVRTTAGSTYEKYFYPKDEHRIPKWLATMHRKGNAVAKLEAEHVAQYQGPQVVPSLQVAPTTTLASTAAKPTSGDVAFQHSQTEAQLEAARLEYRDDVKYAYERLGDKLRSLDPKGVDAWKKLSDLDTKREALADRMKGLREKLLKLTPDTPGVKDVQDELTSLQADKDALDAQHANLLTDFTKRPLSMRIARVYRLKREIKDVQRQAEAWTEQNPKEWAAFLKEHEARVKKIVKDGGKAPPTPRFPPWVTVQVGYLSEVPLRADAALHKLSWKLKGVSGNVHTVAKRQVRTASGENLRVLSSEDINGLTPDRAPISYLLSSGDWEFKDEQGRNRFLPHHQKALLDEYNGIIRNISRGSGWGGHAKGWARTLDLKDLAEDLESYLRTHLLTQLAPNYSADEAQRGREMGKNFEAFVLSQLKGKAQNFIRKRLQEGIANKEIEPEVLHEVGPSLTWDEEGALTRDQMRHLTDALGTPYASAEDIVAIKDAQRIITTRLSPIAGYGLLSRLNLFNPVDDPKGGGGLKDWTSVAQDVVAALTVQGRTDVPSVTYVKNVLTRNLKQLTRVAGEGFAAGLKPSEKVGLHEGLKALLRIAGKRQLSVPGESDWARTKEPVKPGKHKHSRPGVTEARPLHSKIHRQVPSMPAAPSGPLRTKPIATGFMPTSFWESQRRKKPSKILTPVGQGSHRVFATSGVASTFDPATALDLGLDTFAVPGVKAPTSLKAKHQRAAKLASAWQKLSALPDAELQAMTTTPAFSQFEQAWHAERDANTAKLVLAQEKLRRDQEQLKADPKDRLTEKFPVKTAFKLGNIQVSGVPPADLAKIAALIQQQRAIDTQKSMFTLRKGLKLKSTLAAVLLKLKRLLKV
jgi:hypothetical protein